MKLKRTVAWVEEMEVLVWCWLSIEMIVLSYSPHQYSIHRYIPTSFNLNLNVVHLYVE